MVEIDDISLISPLCSDDFALRPVNLQLRSKEQLDLVPTRR